MFYNDKKRASRLPTYLHEKVWIELAEVIDKIFNRQVDQNVKRLLDLNSVENVHPETMVRDEGTQLFTFDSNKFEDELWLDKPLRVAQANDLGFTFYDSSVIPEESYETMLSQGTQYWGQVGGDDLDDFLGFLLNADITLFYLYTKDYVDFVKEVPDGESMVHQGGQYYLTSHIALEVNGNISSAIDTKRLTDLLYLFCPIHLVMHSLNLTFKIPIGMDEKGNPSGL